MASIKKQEYQTSFGYKGSKNDLKKKKNTSKTFENDLVHKSSFTPERLPRQEGEGKNEENKHIKAKHSQDINNQQSVFYVNKHSPNIKILDSNMLKIPKEARQQLSPSFSNFLNEEKDTQLTSVEERRFLSKNRIDDSVKRSQNVNSSWISASSMSYNLPNQSKDSNECKSHKNNISTRTANPQYPCNNLANISDDNINVTNENNVPLHSQDDNDFDYFVLEKATQSALKNITSKLLGIKDKDRGQNFSNQNQKILRQPKTENELDKSHNKNKILNSSLKEVFINTPTLSATNEKKVLPRRSIEITNIKTNSFLARTNESPSFEKEERVKTPVPYIQKVLKRANHALDSGSKIHNLSQDIQSESEMNKPSYISFQNKQQNEKNLQIKDNSDTFSFLSKKFSFDQIEPNSLRVQTEPSLLQQTSMKKRELTDGNDHTLNKEEEDKGISGDIIESSQEKKYQIVENLTQQECYSELLEAIKKINIRTFLNLRNIIKPNENILICCQAFVKLFAGLNETIPSSFSIMENIEWGNIKVLFSTPAKVLKLISNLPGLLESKKIPYRNINSAFNTLSKISYDQADIHNEGFYQIYELINYSIGYYKLCSTENTPSRKASEGTNQFNQIQQTSPAKAKISENRSKTPIRLSTENFNQKFDSVSVSNSHIGMRTSPSPLNVNTSPEKIPHHQSKGSKFQYNSMQRSASSTRSGTTGKRIIYESRSPLRLSKSTLKADSLGTSFEKHYFTEVCMETDNDFINQRSETIEFDPLNMSEFHDEIARKKKEAQHYKGKASRLMFEYERYIKRTLQEQQEEKEKIERELESNDRTRLSGYLEAQKKAEKSYLKDLALEKVNAEREVKEKEAKLKEEVLKDELKETMKHRVFVATQNERKKHEKKKQLWEQYKTIMAEKQAKRQKETEEIINQKKELMDQKAKDCEWKKKSVTQERDMWKENYLTVLKLVSGSKQG